MGTYRFSADEIKDSIIYALDNMDREIFKEDFNKAVREVKKTYERFSDEW